MTNLNEDIYKIYENQHKFIENGGSTRSPDIVKELHLYIKNFFINKLPGYDIVCMDTKEEVVEGAFNNKKVDVAIIKNNKVLGIVAIKSIRQSYNKNNANYFENMIGETINLKLKGIKVFQFIVMPEKGQYMVKGKKKTELITDTQLLKYYKLNSSNFNLKPDFLVIKLLSFDFKNFKASQATLENFENKELINYIKENDDIDSKLIKFSEVIVNE
jgi:hypothetical protein